MGLQVGGEEGIKKRRMNVSAQRSSRKRGKNLIKEKQRLDRGSARGCLLVLLKTDFREN